MSEYHNPVLLKESIDALVLNTDGLYADATFGGGGHSREILSRLSEKGKLMAFDKDEDASSQTIDDRRFTLIHNNFRFIHNFTMLYEGIEGKLDGIIADIGVSSHQFDTAERGFSFRFDAPLDMRMNMQGEKTAVDVVNSYPEEELEKVLRLYGEVDNSHKIARMIVSARESNPIRTTNDLCRILSPALPSFAAHKQLSRIFQAFRIEVNDELRSLDKFMEGATASLKKGGRLVVITYHSLEDRIVKNFIRTGNSAGKEEKDSFGQKKAPLKAVNNKPITPTEEEIERNTRARSAKLRIAERI